MAELKTKRHAGDVTAFLEGIADERVRKDAFTVLDLMKKVTRHEPAMWGSSIVGFGTYHYVYASGREGDWPVTGFAPRKKELTLYFMSGFDRHAALMKKLGKYKTGKSCLYIRTLDDIHIPTLRQLVKDSVAAMKKLYPPRAKA